MLGKKVKPFVYTAHGKDEQGFTLLSLLLMITILFITLPLLASLVNAVTYTTNYEEISVQQFFQFLRDDFMSATAYDIRHHKLIIYDSDGKEISFERYHQVVLRKVDDTGHDIYLRDIKDINFKRLPYGIQAEITSLEGKTYEKTIIYYE